jgi:hypothetical protein
MLSYFQFLLLSLDEKKHYINERATFLLSYPDTTHELRLYAMGSFFVEMHLDEHEQVIEIISFKGYNRLANHTQYISLAQL